MFPRWRGLNHFNHLLKQKFTDGRKFEDISKVCSDSYFILLRFHLITREFRQIVIYIAHTVLKKNRSWQGYLLLRCIRCYIELDMYVGLDVQTEETIAAGRALVLQLGDLINVS